jgi:ADP-heptose:LPS heptosyltransferase
LSLPLAFRTNLKSIPSAVGYVKSSADRVVHWQAKLGAASKPRIGLAWSGSTTYKYDNRSLSLAELIRKLPDGLQYVSLHNELREADKQALQGSPAVLNFAGGLDFNETAALCECLDLVVTIDTSLAHLSGALVKKTWILLAFNPDWRWLLNRSDSPWYPTATLYRQETIGDWDGVLMRVAADLNRAFK